MTCARCSTLLALLAVMACSVACGDEGIVNVAGKHLDILRNGKPLVRYMYALDTSSAEARHDTYKVYHHVFDPSGKQLITKGPGGKFTHHRGLFIGFSRIKHDGKTYDLWHMKDQCNLVHKRIIDTDVTKDSTTVTTQIHWEIAPGKPILEEQRTLTVHFTDDKAHLLTDWTSRLKAVAGDVLLAADPEHGGMQYRPSNEVADNKSATYTFHEPGIDPKRAKDMPWVALTYKLGEQLYSVQQMRHPGNPAGSVYSAYRDYGRFGNYFSTTVNSGETLTLKYRFRITLGPAPSREAMAAEYQEYAK